MASGRQRVSMPMKGIPKGEENGGGARARGVSHRARVDGSRWPRVRVVNCGGVVANSVDVEWGDVGKCGAEDDIYGSKELPQKLRGGSVSSMFATEGGVEAHDNLIVVAAAW